VFNLFKKKEKEIDQNNILSKVASLLIHAAKIDENYTDKEKNIIKKTLIELGVDEKDIVETMKKAEKNESDSNQILNFTREIKNLNDDDKKKIVESLWNIIYSDSESDMYEANLMRRLSGLLYLDDKIVGEIKEKIKSKISK
tara:strand:+ start:2427 stop:2852 length:426 start_codon:yes stop_codon:yes gene_type:complete